MQKILSNKTFFVFFSLFFVSISYLSVLNGELIGDDLLRIGQNNELSNLSEALSGGLGDRPMLMFMMWLEQGFLKLPFWAMRLISIFFHILFCTSLLYLIEVLSKVYEVKVNKKLLLIFFLLFSIHPLHSQTITTIIQRGVIMSSLFGVLSFIFFIGYLYGEKNNRQSCLLSYFYFFIGILFKPNIIFLPFILTYFSFTNKRKVLNTIPFYLIAALTFVFYGVLEKNKQSSITIENVLNYSLDQLQSFFIYIKLFIFPYGLKFLYDLDQLNFVFNSFLVILIISFIFLTCSYNKNGLSRLLFICFFMSLIPESSFFPIMHSVFEHRFYLPSAFLISAIFIILNNKIKVDKKTFIISSLIIALFIGLNQFRNKQIRKRSSWIKHTIANSYSHDEFNWEACLELMQFGEYEFLDKLLIEHVNRKSTFVDLYKLLQKINSWHRDNSFAKAKEILNDMRKPVFKTVSVQTGFIIFLLRDFNQYLLWEKEYLFLFEEYLSENTKLLLNKNITNTLSFNRLHASALFDVKKYLSSKNNLSNKETFKFLKVRTILFRYYNINDDKLKNDINLALKNQSGFTEAIKYLKKVVNEK